jgi:hypothetical protein
MRNIVHRESLAFFKFDFAAASMIFLPVAVEPVNATLSTSGWADRAAPPMCPYEGMVFITPDGKLRRESALLVIQTVQRA